MFFEGHAAGPGKRCEEISYLCADFVSTAKPARDETMSTFLGVVYFHLAGKYRVPATISTRNLRVNTLPLFVLGDMLSLSKNAKRRGARVPQYAEK